MIFLLKHIFWDKLRMEEKEEWHFFFPVVYLLIFTTLITWGMSWTFNLLSSALMQWIMDSPAWHITRLQFKVDVTNTIAPSGAKAWLSFQDKPLRSYEFITDFIFSIALICFFNSKIHFGFFFKKLASCCWYILHKPLEFSYKQDLNTSPDFPEAREMLHKLWRENSKSISFLH